MKSLKNLFSRNSDIQPLYHELSEICPICHTILDEIVEYVKAFSQAVIGGLVRRQAKWWKEYEVKQSSSQLRLSASKGCQFCYLRWQDLFDMAPVYERMPSFETYFAEVRWDRSKPEAWTVGLTYRVGINGKWSAFKFESEILSDHWTYIPKPKFLAEATEDTEQNEAQGLRWDLVRAWLKQCTSEHKICCRMNEESDFLPTRLLDLGSGPSLQLRLRDSYTLPSKTKYTTLSHCWGKLEITKLLQSNIEDMRHTIPSSQLCKTFLDAIEVTKQLGAQYLWIDSLCIMQDSTHDWVQESEMMYDIYKHSMCNIAATSAVDGSCGMLSPLRSKQPLSGQAVRILVPLKSRDTVIIGYSESIWMREIDDAPLRSRAWVVQELVLSPRVLHFGARQMFWDCAQLRASETFQTGTYSGFINNNKVAPGCLLDSVTLESSSAMQRRSKLTWQLVQRWMQLVEEYTACSLTVASDRLLAISGLAKSMPFIHDRYFAGMWHLFFELQMLWKVAQSRKPKMPAILKGSNYQPPSWSWASMDVEVEFEYKRSPYPRTNRVASVIKIDVSLASNDPTGAVVGGVARLKCPMIKAFQETCSYSLLWDHSKPELFRGDFIYLLLISSTTGLIIAPTKTKAGEFKRKGYFSPDFSTIVQNNINITKAADEMASRCMESINILSEREYESAEPDADFGHVFTITII